jgi:hypothetical protein
MCSLASIQPLFFLQYLGDFLIRKRFDHLEQLGETLFIFLRLFGLHLLEFEIDCFGQLRNGWSLKEPLRREFYLESFTELSNELNGQ